MATIRLGKRTENRSPLIKDFVPLADARTTSCSARGIRFADDAYTAAKKAGVLEDRDLEPIKDFLSAIKPMPAVFENKYVTRINGTNVKKGKTKRDLAEQLRQDIRDFKAKNKCDRVVIVWCASTEIFIKPGPQHATLEQFERAMENNDEAIAPSMLYAYAAIMEGVPFCNGAPNLVGRHPGARAARERARRADLGQGLQDRPDVDEDRHRAGPQGAHARPRRLVFDEHPRQPRRRSARRSRVVQDEGRVEALACCTRSCSPRSIPTLYKGFSHVVRINYYPPRGDNKEGWDNIDIVGWMGYPMQIKVNFLCRDSILAAPIVLDLALFSDFAQRAGHEGDPGMALASTTRAR